MEPLAAFCNRSNGDSGEGDYFQHHDPRDNGRCLAALTQLSAEYEVGQIIMHCEKLLGSSCGGVQPQANSRQCYNIRLEYTTVQYYDL